MGCIALVRCVLVLRCGSAGVVWYPDAETGAIEKTALDWNPQRYRRTGRPKRTWRWTVEGEIRRTRRSWNEVQGIAGDRNGWKLRRTRRSWNEVQGIAGDRNGWKLFMDALCYTRSERICWWWWVCEGAIFLAQVNILSLVLPTLDKENPLDGEVLRSKL